MNTAFTKKTELIQRIETKIAKARSPVRKLLLSGLKRKTLSELRRTLRDAHVVNDGWDIELLPKT